AGVIRVECFSSPILKSLSCRFLRARSNRQRGHLAAHLTCQAERNAQSLPRDREHLSLILIEVNKEFVCHQSTFSARILSTSFAAISWGVSPVIISVFTSRTGGFSTTGQVTWLCGA